jgi:hypothetical protein
MANVNVSPAQVAEVEIDSFELGERITVKEYFKAILRRMIEDPLDPFALLDWQEEVYPALVRVGAVDGELDEDGIIKEFDQNAADQILLKIVESL